SYNEESYALYDALGSSIWNTSSPLFMVLLDLTDHHISASFDITIVEAELALGYMFIDYKTKAHFAPEGFLTIDGTTIKAMSERVYILPVHLQWTTFEEYSISSFSFYDIDIELRALGYRFRTLLRYGVIQVPNFTLPFPSS
ncbi:hypothetical protein FOZ62_007677, partial [Perkinsus olseni]